VKRSATARNRNRSSVRRCFVTQSSSCSPAMKRRAARSCVTHWQLHQRHSGFPAACGGDFPARQEPDAHVRAEWQPVREKSLRCIGAPPGTFSRHDRALTSSFARGGPEARSTVLAVGHSITVAARKRAYVYVSGAQRIQEYKLLRPARTAFSCLSPRRQSFFMTRAELRVKTFASLTFDCFGSAPSSQPSGTTEIE
jgi:hypothetical protein